jgi:hypothetical protein
VGLKTSLDEMALKNIPSLPPPGIQPSSSSSKPSLYNDITPTPHLVAQRIQFCGAEAAGLITSSRCVMLTASAGTGY